MPEIRNIVPAQHLTESSGHCQSIKDALTQVKFRDNLLQKVLGYRSTGRVELSGISTGYNQMDEVLDGFQKQQLILLAARAGMGKTWVALNFIKNISIDQKIPTALFSLEMSNDQVLYRLVSLQSGVPIKVIKNGTLDDEQFSQVEQAVETIKNSPLYLTDNPANSMLSTLNNNIANAYRELDAKIIFIDHIGLVNTSKVAKEQRAIEMGEITRALKISARTFAIPIVCLAQLNRNADNNEQPKLSHLRESGSLEQDSDVVLLINRADYYKQGYRPGEVDIIIAKNRDGEQSITVSCSYSTSWLLTEKSAHLAQQASKKQQLNVEGKMLSYGQNLLTSKMNLPD